MNGECDLEDPSPQHYSFLDLDNHNLPVTVSIRSSQKLHLFFFFFPQILRRDLLSKLKSFCLNCDTAILQVGVRNSKFSGSVRFGNGELNGGESGGCDHGRWSNQR